MQELLTIVIPTTKYSEFLDEAISSAIYHRDKKFKVVVSMNSLSSNFEKSRFWDSSEVDWRRVDDYKPHQFESFNYALQRCDTPWIFILSDDDLLTENFLSSVNLGDLNYSDLIYTRTQSFRGDFEVIGTQRAEIDSCLNKDDMVCRYYQHDLNHSVSSFVFSKKIFESIGGFTESGYPNGYYVDTIFHGKLLTRSKKTYLEKNVSVLRRLSLDQGSAKFYFNYSFVNGYFNDIAAICGEDSIFLQSIIENYGTLEAFRVSLQRHRFFIELSKLHQKIYGKSFKDNLQFITNFLLWDVGVFFKLKSLPLILFFPLKRVLGKGMQQKIKKIVLGN